MSITTVYIQYKENIMKNREFDSYVYEDFEDSQDPIDLDDFKKQIIKDTEKKMLDRSRNYRGRSDTVWLKITTSILADLFNVNKRTVLRWKKLNKFNPRDIRSIIKLYNNCSIKWFSYLEVYSYFSPAHCDHQVILIKQALFLSGRIRLTDLMIYHNKDLQ